MATHSLSFFCRQERTPGGATGAHICTVTAVVKHNSEDAPYCVANEIICGKLAQSIGLPVPAFSAGVDAFDETKPPCFVTLSFARSIGGSPPLSGDRAGKCVRTFPSLTTGALLFDILIANGDRHEGNVHFREASPSEFYIFDHSHALFGASRHQATNRFETMRNRLGITGTPTSGARHIFLDPLKQLQHSSPTHVQEWLDRVKSIPDWLIRESCEYAFELARQDSQGGMSQTEHREAIEFLRWRRGRIQDMIRQVEIAP